MADSRWMTGATAQARRVLQVLTLLAACAPGLVRADPTDDYNVAVEFFKQERWDLAERSFREFLTRNARHSQAPTAQLYLGQSLVNQRRFADARTVFREFLAAHADLDEASIARYRIAESSYFLQDNPAALSELKDFRQHHPDHDLAVRAQLYQAQTELKLGDPRAAADSFDQVIQSKTPEASLVEEAKFGRARALEDQGEKDAAANLYRELAAERSGAFAPDAQFRLAALRFEAHDFAAAAREFAAVPANFPGHRLVPMAELNAGYAEYSLDHVPLAIEHFERVASDPAHAPTARLWIGLSRKKSGDLAAASRTFRAAYEQDEDQPLADRLLFHWADSALRSQDYPEAQRLFLTIVERWPDNDRADDSLHLATEAALRAKDLDTAQRLNQQFQTHYAGSGLRWLQQVIAGRIHLARGDAAAIAQADSPEAAEQFRLAATQFSQVIAESEVGPTKAVARLQLARAHERLHEPEQVRDALQPLMDDFQTGKIDPELVESLLMYADALLALKQPREAAAAVELYLAQPVSVGRGDAWGRLAVARAQLGDQEGVAAALDSVAEADGSGMTLARVAYECAELAYAAKEWDWAASLFGRTTALDPDTGFHAAALSGLGYAQHEAGRHAEAAEAFATLLSTHAEDRRLASNAAHMRGLSLQLAGDAAAAAAAYLEGYAKFQSGKGGTPAADDPEAAYNAYRCAKGAARIFRELDQVDEADAAYSQAYDELTRHPTAGAKELDKLLNEWALLAYEHEQYARSDELFTRLVTEFPQSDLADDARLYLGESQFFAGKLDEAQASFESLAALDTADPFVKQRASLLLLDIAADRQDWPKLLERADQFVAAFPESDQRFYARYRAGEAALETGDADRTIAELTPLVREPVPAVAEAEWMPSVWMLLAEAHLRKKAYDVVESTLAEFRGKFPDSPHLYHADEILGRAYKNRAMFEQARDSFRKVVDSETGRRTETAAKAQFHIAETFLIEKNLVAALSEYYKVYVNYRFPEWQAPALFQAGQCDESLGHWDGAAKSYTALIAEFPTSEFAERARERLEVARQKLGE